MRTNQTCGPSLSGLRLVTSWWPTATKVPPRFGFLPEAAAALVALPPVAALAAGAVPATAAPVPVAAVGWATGAAVGIVPIVGVARTALGAAPVGAGAAPPHA